MDNELRLNDQGEVERKVVSYEKVELAQLESTVTENQAALDGTNTELETAKARVTELEAQAHTQEGALSDSKSQLEAYSQVAPAEPATDDAGAEATEPAAEESTESEADTETPVPQF